MTLELPDNQGLLSTVHIGDNHSPVGNCYSATVSFMKIRTIILASALTSLLPAIIAERQVKYLEKGKEQPPTVESILTWDSLGKRHQSAPDELDVGFEFRFENETNKEVRITRAFTSCGCTVAKLPATPWIIKPGQKGSIPIIMDMRGKSGIIIKDTTIVTNLGSITLTTKVSVSAANIPAGRTRSPEERAANLKLAAKNRQAIFQGKCVECHVVPTIGKRGRQLYSTACGICHEAKNRASFVPDLRTLAVGKDQQYWEQWIAESKPNTLMPAFSKLRGGTLDSNQIRTLVAYLTRIYPRELKTRRAIALKKKPALK